jgi:hypothetical protein
MTRIHYSYKIIEWAFRAFQELLEGESRPQKKSSDGIFPEIQSGRSASLHEVQLRCNL